MTRPLRKPPAPAQIGRPEKQPHEKRSAQRLVRFTPAEDAHIAAAAAQAGIAPTEFIRRAALARPIPKASASRSDTNALLAMHKLARALGPIGNNMNQIAHAAHLDRTLAGKLSQALDEIGALRGDVRQLLDRMAEDL
ncbi:MAG: plasmid mobilization relaxosome protein MobC [Pseudomonadota bacterium]